MVLDKVCKGYKLKDKWLRAPQVIVGNRHGGSVARSRLRILNLNK